MKTQITFIVCLSFMCSSIIAQHVGIGTDKPTSQLHIQDQVQNQLVVQDDFEDNMMNPPYNESMEQWFVSSAESNSGSFSLQAPGIITGEVSFYYDVVIEKGHMVTIRGFKQHPKLLGEIIGVELTYNGIIVKSFELDTDNTSGSFIEFAKYFALTEDINQVRFFFQPSGNITALDFYFDDITIEYKDGHALRIQDGQETSGAILVSDSLGNASWSTDFTSFLQDSSATNEIQQLNYADGLLDITQGNTVQLDHIAIETYKLRIASNGGVTWGLNDTISGGFSTAWGYQTAAKNGNATAWGANTLASAPTSTAWGNSTKATGIFSTAFGQSTQSTATLATSWGYVSKATDILSTAWGNLTTASGEQSTAWGSSTTASGLQATVWGDMNLASGSKSTAWGMNTQATDSLSTAWGIETLSSGIASTALGKWSMATGDYSFASGLQTEATGEFSIAVGHFSKAQNEGSFAGGKSSIASGIHAFAYGHGAQGEGQASASLGYFTHAKGNSSLAWGEFSDAFGYQSTAGGFRTLANSRGEIAIGQYNYSPVGGNPNVWVDTDQLFSLGNGTSTANRNNVLTLLKDGKLGLNKNEPDYALDIVTDGNDFIQFKSTGGNTNLRLDGFSGTNVLEWRSDGAFKASLGYSIENDRIFCYQGTNVWYVWNSRFGIKNPTPSYDLHMQNNSAAKPTSSSWTVASDRRLKTDVHSFTDGLNVLMQIKPVWFTYNGEANMPQETGVGTIAQELENVAPYMVNDWTYEDEETKTKQDYKAVDYGAMDFVIINAIQELKAEMDEANKKIEALEKENIQLKFKLAKQN